MATLSVVGLGYIGLPTAALFATHGHTVHGYDVRPDVVSRLRKGEAHIEEPGLAAFTRDAVASGRLLPDDKLHPADVFIICVPTPLDHATLKADLTAVRSATQAVAGLVKKGDLVILESTVPAGTTERVVVPLLERSGLDATKDLLVAHCPETVLPGNMIHEIVNNHRVVGGYTPEAANAAASLYASVVRGEIVRTDATTAEFVKLAQNSYRDVNIALANEFALACRNLGIDARAAIKIANRHPRVHIHQPGPGVGGHCIPVDPWFIVEAYPGSEVIRDARRFNDRMPGRVVDIVQKALGRHSGPTIALLGLSYKANVEDVRESPSFEIRKLLLSAYPKATVRVVDPHVPLGAHDTVGLDDALDGAHCLLLATDHAEFRDLSPRRAATRMKRRLLVDTRGLYDAAAWRAEGFTVERL